MLKIFLGFCVVVFSVIAGKKFTAKYKDRADFYSALSDFNSLLIRDMGYLKEGVLPAMEGDYGCEKFGEYLKRVKSAIVENKVIPAAPDFLEERDAVRVREYFSAIGRYSSFSQSDLLLSSRKEFSDRYGELKIKSAKSSALGTKLGFALGATVFIIII